MCWLCCNVSLLTRIHISFSWMVSSLTYASRVAESYLILHTIAHIPSCVYPFLNTTTNTYPSEYLRLTSLGVIGALLKVRIYSTSSLPTSPIFYLLISIFDSKMTTAPPSDSCSPQILSHPVSESWRVTPRWQRSSPFSSFRRFCLTMLDWHIYATLPNDSRPQLRHWITWSIKWWRLKRIACWSASLVAIYILAIIRRMSFCICSPRARIDPATARERLFVNLFQNPSRTKRSQTSLRYTSIRCSLNLLLSSILGRYGYEAMSHYSDYQSWVEVGRDPWKCLVRTYGYGSTAIFFDILVGRRWLSMWLP